MECEMWRWTYQYPEEKCNLKCILEEYKMNQQKDNSGSMEPKMVVWRFYYQFTFNSYMFLGNLMSQLRNYMLQLSAHSKQQLNNK